MTIKSYFFVLQQMRILYQVQVKIFGDMILKLFQYQAHIGQVFVQVLRILKHSDLLLHLQVFKLVLYQLYLVPQHNDHDLLISVHKRRCQFVF